MEVQEKLPAARVVYCSATGASSVKNLAYMVRLGLWGPETAFEDFGTFNSAIEKAGYGGMVPGCDRAHQPWAAPWPPHAHQPWAPCDPCLLRSSWRST